MRQIFNVFLMLALVIFYGIVIYSDDLPENEGIALDGSISDSSSYFNTASTVGQKDETPLTATNDQAMTDSDSAIFFDAPQDFNTQHRDEANEYSLPAMTLISRN